MCVAWALNGPVIGAQCAMLGRSLGALLGRSLGDPRSHLVCFAWALLGCSLVVDWELIVHGLGAQWAFAGRFIGDAWMLLGGSTLAPYVLCLGARWVIHARTMCALLGSRWSVAGRSMCDAWVLHAHNLCALLGLSLGDPCSHLVYFAWAHLACALG